MAPSSLPRLPVFAAIAQHDPESTVVVHSLSGRRFAYGELLGDVRRVRDQMAAAAGNTDLDGERVAFLVENSYDYVVTLLAILATRSIAVPLSPAFPIPELQYIVDHSEARLLLSSAKFAAKAKELMAAELASRPAHLSLAKHLGGGPHEAVELDEQQDAGKAGMMLYTSGTTNRPKGVLLPERVMTAQAQSLKKAWEYAASDHLLHVLPLHHIHGIINALYTPLFAGSSIEFLFPFNADAVWRRFAAPFLPEANGTKAAVVGNGVTKEHGAAAQNTGANGAHASEANGMAAQATPTNGHKQHDATVSSPATNGDGHVNGHTNGHANGTSSTNGHTNGSNGYANGHTNGANGTAAPAPAQREPVTFFTVVPTVYSRLLATHKELSPAVQEAARTAISPAHLRVNISGSAALPTPIKQAWTDLSRGNVLLERFGMTEVGMALSCGLRMDDRVDGSVGWPLPSVEARLVDVDTGAVLRYDDDDNANVADSKSPSVDATGRERAGEIQLRGPTIFAEYWRNPAATASEFVAPAADDPNRQPWFKTGDVAVRRAVKTTDTAKGAGGLPPAPSQDWTRQGPLYFILGRRSADIIKSGGEKVSALEVERELLSLPMVAEAAVVAVPSGKWGQKVGAVVVLAEDQAATWSVLGMRRALKGRLVNYKIPQVLRVVPHIPRNAMGKINKRQLVAAVFAEEYSGDEAPPPPASTKKRRTVASVEEEAQVPQATGGKENGSAVENNDDGDRPAKRQKA
ncbi:AMP-dependent synthetase/ligase [Niveomyces insectorum RCEF 264]|uniref:AMP-dependent synthetase/ligase n=1 Tax=Niveomyces insectorum RCEF 264 TaxID=1081102 RepID=A0A167UZ84_9HYPO|nr:AMP-dependent synthetase/ligase [Niveomyces insectorum RCEF 264]